MALQARSYFCQDQIKFIMENLITLIIGICIGVFCCENKGANEAIKAIWSRISGTVKGWIKKGGL